MPRHHKLHIYQDNYQPIVDGAKLADIRFNDRDYQVGDTITYYSGYPAIPVYHYDGRMIDVVITNIDKGIGLLDGYVNLSIKLIDESELAK